MNLILSIMMLASLSFGQTRVAADILLGNESTRNFIKNSSCDYNTEGITVTSATKSRLAQDPGSTPGIGPQSCRVTTTTNGATAVFETNNLDQYLIGRNCEVKARYVLYDTGSSSVGAVYAKATNDDGYETPEVQLETSTSGLTLQSKELSFVLPCGGTYAAAVASTNKKAPKLRFRFTTPNINTSLGLVQVYSGEVRSFGVVPAISDWQSYTPTYTGFGTVVTSNMWWRRVGGDIEIRGRFVAPGSSAVEARMSLPSGLISSNAITTLETAGIAGDNSAAATTRFGIQVLREPNVGYVTFTSHTSSVNSLTKDTGSNIVFAAGMVISIEGVRVPIAGWSASQSAASIGCLTNGACENVFTAKVSSTGVVTDETYDWINGNCTNASPTVCTFTSNFFNSVTPNCFANNTDTGTSDGNNIVTTSSQLSITFTAGAKRSFTLQCTRAGTDVRPKVSSPILTGSVTSDYAGSEILIHGRYYGASVTTVCSASPCTVRSNLTGLTVTRTGSGAYSINVPAGKLTGNTDCFFTVSNGGANPEIALNYPDPGTTAITFTTGNSSSGSVADTFGSFLCIGAR